MENYELVGVSLSDYVLLKSARRPQADDRYDVITAIVEKA
jgi:hypothetical protein